MISWYLSASYDLFVVGVSMYDSIVCKVYPDCEHVLEKHHEVNYYLVYYFVHEISVWGENLLEGS